MPKFNLFQFTKFLSRQNNENRHCGISGRINQMGKLFFNSFMDHLIRVKCPNGSQWKDSFGVFTINKVMEEYYDE